MQPSETIVEFDRFLAARGLKFEAVIIGGAALGLLGVTFRETRDCDVLHPALPEKVAAAAREFASQRDNPLLPSHVREVVEDLRKRLGHGV